MLSRQSISCAMLMGAVLYGAGTIPAPAQDGPMGPPPNILVIQREYLKPGRAGAIHQKSESAFVRALRDHHGTTRYIGLSSMSGKSRALFFSGYPTLAAWEQDDKAMAADPALASDIDRATVADGDLLSSYDQTVWRYRPDLSRNPGVHPGDRYMQILSFTVKPGHAQDWEHMASMISDGYKKGEPSAHWDIFQSIFGTTGDTYLVIIPRKNMGEMDQEEMHSKDFEAAMGEDGLKKLDVISAEAIESSGTNLFRLDPKMSYPPDMFIKGEPGFWNKNAGAGDDDHPGATH